MKLNKLLPLVALVLSLTANSAFAKVDAMANVVGKMCEHEAVHLLKNDRKVANAQTPPPAETSNQLLDQVHVLDGVAK